MPATRAHVVLIVAPNIICMLLHLFGSMPQGPDYHRGYLHGGVVVDFVGQMPSTSRLYYLLADVVLLVLQSLMMTIHNEREKLRVALKTFRPINPELTQQVSQAWAMEDLDAEERGVSRDDSYASVGDGSNDIELQPLNGDATNADDMEGSTRDSVGDSSSQSQLSDLLSSGNGVLGEYHVIHAMRVALTHLEGAAAGTLHRIGYEATTVALQARRRQNAMRGQTTVTNR